MGPERDRADLQEVGYAILSPVPGGCTIQSRSARDTPCESNIGRSGIE